MVHCFIEGSQGVPIVIPIKSLKIDFVSANTEDPDEMQQCCISSGSSLFAKVPVLGFLVIKGLNMLDFIAAYLLYRASLSGKNSEGPNQTLRFLLREYEHAT